MSEANPRARGAAPSPELARVIGLPGAVWLGLGSILGTGVFVSLGLATGVIGNGVVPAVALAALVATATGLSSAQLAAAHPVSGGTYEYGHRFVGPAAGFAAGWVFLAAKGASAATAALGCSGYLLHSLGLPTGFATRVGVALALVAAVTTLVASGLSRSNRVNIAVVSFTLFGLLAFVVFGWLSVDRSLLTQRIGPMTWLTAVQSPRALLHATALLFVAYAGFGRIATLGEEVRDPARTIPRAIMATLVLTMLVYLAVSATAVAVVGVGVFGASTHGTGATLEEVARAFRHPHVAAIVAASAVTAMAGVLLNLLLGLSRVLLAMARRREMPVWLDRVTEAGSPARAVWAIGGLIAGLTALGDLKTTWSFSAFNVLVYYGITNLAALRLPPEARRFPRWVSWAGLCSCLGLAFFVEWPIWVAGLSMIAAGGLFRAWILR
ncbi:MAG: APA family basic amino acid/polyamine antiporter [Bradymonadia bacterium]|jgi:APA family basic amino acid/polyamine antiporter